MGAVFIITRQKKKTRTESARIKNQKCGISKKFRCCRRTDRSCKGCARGSFTVPAPPVCLLPVCSYARLTAYCGILPTRSPILSERDLTPSSSARGATLAVMASSVSRILPGQEYSIVAAIATRGAYCNAPPLIPQGQKRKMFLIAKKF